MFVSYPELRTDLVTGGALSAVVLCLLRVPASARHYFAGRPTTGELPPA
jgi:hypothetical protein